MFNVLSLFDGISGTQLALKRANINIDNYYASEIDEHAISITMKNFPNTIQLGDVTKIKGSKLPKIDLIVAGSPCQGFSFAGRRKGMVTTENIEITSIKQYLQLKKEGFQFDGQSYLFWEVIRLIKEIKPKYFLIENVKMNKKWMYIISKELGVLPILINSSCVSIQNRERNYWTNIPNVSHPIIKNIVLSNVIPNAVGGYGIRGRKNKITGKYDQMGTIRKDNKVNCITTSKGNTSMISLIDGSIRKLTIEEAEIAQTLPLNYTKVKHLSETNRWHGIGNGFTIDVVSHILKNIK